MAASMQRFVTLGQEMPEKRPAGERRADFQEIYQAYAAERAAEQASRCSQCGVPFCQVHCPLQNNIPDWLKLTAEGRLRGGLRAVRRDQQHARDLRPHLPAGPAVRRQLRHRAVGPRHGHHRRGREIHHRHRLGSGLGQADHGRARERGQSVGIIGAGPGRARRRRGACAGRAIQVHGLRPPRPRRRPADLRHSELQAGEGGRRAPRRRSSRKRHRASRSNCEIGRDGQLRRAARAATTRC